MAPPTRVSLCHTHDKIWRRGSELNRRIEVLQTSALPLGYRALLTNHPLVKRTHCRENLRFLHRFPPLAHENEQREEVGKNKCHEPASQPTHWYLLRSRQSQRQGKMTNGRRHGDHF